MKRCNQQLFQLGDMVLAGQVNEQLLHIQRHLRILGEVADVGIQACSFWVVVAS